MANSALVADAYAAARHNADVMRQDRNWPVATERTLIKISEGAISFG